MKFNKLKLNKKIVGIIDSNDLTKIKGGGTITCQTCPEFCCDDHEPPTTLHFCRHSESWQGNFC